MNEGGRGIKVPLELCAIPSRVVEEYVRARLIQFATPFARKCNPTLPQALVQEAAVQAIQTLPPPEYGSSSVEDRDLQLVFRHDCLSLGCLDPQCVLCEHNPHRRCNVNFAPKYLVSDVLKAKCEAPIRVEIIDRSTGIPVGDDISGVHLEMVVLDGNAYDAKCLEMGAERDGELDSCALLLNNKQAPLLAAGPSATYTDHHRVIVQLARGMAQLPELTVSDSSEAMLSGRKPPFRLLVRAVHDEGRRLSIRHAVSEGFVVATRRTRTAGKVEIPNVDDHVGKLEHMGKETVKKLQDIHGAGRSSGIDISVPSNCINKVGEFRKLALLAESDGHLRQKLQQVLKLSKEKWDEARDHAMRAVVADNRMRVWYADRDRMEMGLLFTCRLGNVELERPVGLLQKKSQDGAQTTMEATLMAQQTPQQRDQVRRLNPQGVAAWWHGGHPGWAIYPVDSDHFMSTGVLDSLPVPTDDISSASPQGGRLGGPHHMFGGGGNPGPSNGGPPFSSAAPYLPGPHTPIGGGMSNRMLGPLGRSGELQLRDPANAGTMFQGGGMGSGALNLSAFQSADLDHLVAHYPSPEGGGGSGSMGQFSMGFGNLESMELPDSAAAMLHGRVGGRNGMAGVPVSVAAASAPQPDSQPPTSSAPGGGGRSSSSDGQQTETGDDCNMKTDD